jgi:hypothetical protein
LNYIDGLVVLNAHVNFRVWDPAMAGKTLLSFLLVFGELLIGLDGLMGDMVLASLFYP